MTAILCWHDGQKGYMAADRRCGSGAEICTDSISKIVRCDPWLIGCAGESLAAEMVLANAQALAKAASPFALSLALRATLTEFGWPPAAKEPGGPPLIESDFLAVHATLGHFVVFSNFSVLQQDRVCQTGCGDHVAQGAFEALRRRGVAVVPALEEAVRIAAYFNMGVGGEPQVEVIG